MGLPNLHFYPRNPQEIIRLLEQELADTNREVMALTLELEKRVEERTSELYVTQEELRKTNFDLLAMTAELENRVIERTRQLGQTNELLRVEIAERKQAEVRLQAQLGRLDLLQRITRAIDERQDLQSIFRVVTQSLEDNLLVDFACVCLYNWAAGTTTTCTVGARSEIYTLGMELADQEVIALDREDMQRVLDGQLVYEPDVNQVDSPLTRRMADLGLRSLVIAPLPVDGKIFGFLMAARRKDHSFTSGDCEFLRQLCEHVSLAAHQAHLYESLQQAYDDLRRTQDAVMQQERLRALGQLASGIAHDINNSISPVSLYVEFLLEREPNLSEHVRTSLLTIKQAVDDVAQTVSRMREFSRKREPEINLTQVPLNRLVKQVTELTRARWKNMSEERGVVLNLETELASDLPDVLGAENEIRDALINLVLNAVDAMPEGGTLSIRTRAARTPSYVCLEICDTGIGMSEETRLHCLDPFFSTKGERGTGLGLAMVYGMAQRHKAEIEVESELGKGTTFRLTFPALRAVSDLPVHRTPVAAIKPLRILLVDDDPRLLRSLHSTLEADGHSITACEGGQAGIEAFTAALNRSEPYSIVITDLGMPKVDGRKVAAAVKAASPSTPVILLTGWGQRLAAEQAIPPNVDRMLNKPPKLIDLRTALAELVVDPPEQQLPI